jgi:hypothetical protein
MIKFALQRGFREPSVRSAGLTTGLVHGYLLCQQLRSVHMSRVEPR